MNKIDSNNINYKEIGLCCGLELHQQLDTHKLFCNCKSMLINDDSKPNSIIIRKLRAVQSESGDKDLTAYYEQKKNKTYKYLFYNQCNCLVETDSQPPLPINKEALDISLIISLLTNSQVLDKTEVMRKQVIDGSNVSGFQRTVLISTDGYLDFDFGRVRIDKIFLEEDAARTINKSDGEITYSLDRLGIPLIELVVWHDIHTPKDVKKVAQNIGQLFRITGKARRGLGSIRQDINISIKDGARTEIKGTQDLELIPQIVNYEVIRQLSLLKVKQELQKRNIKDIILNEQNLNNYFKNSNCKIIKDGLSSKKNVYVFKLENFKNILGYEIQPNKRVGSELSDILKAKTNVKGLFHLDELPNYGIIDKDISFIKEQLLVNDNDSFIMVICKDNEIKDVKYLLQSRLNQLLLGVPTETRVVNVDCTTRYMRNLSNYTRMYPETDILPLIFTNDDINKIKKILPLTKEQRKSLYLEKYKLSEQLTNKMLFDNYAILFENILENNKKVEPTFLAVFLLEDLTRLIRDKKINEEYLSYNKLFEFFMYSKINDIPKSKIDDVFIYYLNNDVSVSFSVKELKIFESLQKIDLNNIIDEILLENKQKIMEQKERVIGLIMGRVMAKTKNLVDGKIISQKVNEKLKLFLKDL